MTGKPTRIPGRNGSAAVMAQRTVSRAVAERRAPGEVETDDAQIALWRSLDWFATPPWGSRAGAEIIRLLDPKCRCVLEPACGDGIMAEPLREYFDVRASDIHDHGFGYHVADFLDHRSTFEQCDWVITNPPFTKAAEFIRRGLEIADRGVAVLCRLSFLEGEGRHTLIYEPPTPLTLCAVFSERLPLQLGPWNPNLSSATAYAWFIFKKGAQRLPITAIRPGTRDRLWRPDDVRRFVKPTPAPLLDILEGTA